MPEGDLLTDAFVFCNRTLGFVNAPVMMQRAVAKMDDLSIDAEPYRKRRDLMVDILTEAGFEFEMPKGGFFVFPKSPIEDEVAFCMHAAQKYKLLIVPGSGFGKAAISDYLSACLRNRSDIRAIFSKHCIKIFLHSFQYIKMGERTHVEEK